MIRSDQDNIHVTKINIYTMSLQKQITITKQDFNNIEKVFHIYLENNPNDLSTLKTIQSLINQSID